MQLESVIFVSSATGELSDSDLESICITARRRNEERQVTGALLYHQGSFLQYFEGPSGGVEEIYRYIRRSRLHHGMMELDRRPLIERQFSSWQMGISHVPHSSILALSNIEWDSAVRKAVEGGLISASVSLLLNFWRNARGPNWPRW